MRPCVLLAALLTLGPACRSEDGRCPVNLVECADGCRDLRIDEANCGGCGLTCEAGERCVAGGCQLSCPSGQVACAGRCIDPESDREFCGAQVDCAGGVACSAGELCSQGICALTCAPPTVACGGRCVDPASDLEYCGADAACVDGQRCAPGEVCSMGSCVAQCQPGFIECNGTCHDPMTSRSYCGADTACMGGSNCRAGEICSGGHCELSCQSGLVECEGLCIDPRTSRMHCGASEPCVGAEAGAVCAAGEVCAAGACALSCPVGQVGCAGTCVDPWTSRILCGASGSCSGAEAGAVCGDGQVCSMGQCQLSCQGGLIDCNDTCVDPMSDRRFCGATGHCTGTRRGLICEDGEVCSSGRCVLSCPTSLLECAGTCIDPLTSRTFCGASGTCTGTASGSACQAGELCASGSCSTSCQSALLACDGICVDPLHDERYCGASGTCSGSSAGDPCGQGEICVSGQCILTCSNGLVACGSQCIDPSTDPNYCGAQPGCTSGTVCGPEESCLAGQCVVTQLSWRHVTPSAGNPRGWAACAMAYDSARARTYMFGGYDPTGTTTLRSNELWSWDGNTWTLEHSGGQGPTPRTGSAMVYDRARGVLVLYGGTTGPAQYDTWSWDGVSWTDVTPASGPSAVNPGRSMAYVSTSSTVVLYDQMGQDTWIWDGASWTDATPTTGNPPARRGGSIVYDESVGRILLVGGEDASNPGLYLRDTWSWSGREWSDVTNIAVRPGGRSGGQLIYDSVRRRVLFFGGSFGPSVSNQTYLTDLWEWKVGAWRLSTPSGTQPTGRWQFGLAFDGGRDQLVLFGGLRYVAPYEVRVDETWEFGP